MKVSPLSHAGAPFPTALHRREFLLGSIGAGIAAFAGVSARGEVPPTESIRALLRQNVGADNKIGGSVAVVVDESGTNMASYGTSGTPDVALDRDTVFEIGSITKVLTALVLADMAARGEVAFDDPIAKYLPASVTLHGRGRPITLLDLATYTSGLPNLPGNFALDRNSPNPFADYTVDELYAFLSSYVPKYEPGTHYEYANLGFGLLGIALARRAGKSYEELVIERVCDPLGLDHTRITFSSGMQRHLAQGYAYASLEPVPPFDIPAMEGAGAFRSNAKDLTAFLEACMGLSQSPLSASLARLLETRRDTRLAGTHAGLGWFISSDPDEEIVWKLGATIGQNTFIGYSARKRRGALVLANGPWHPMGVGLQLLDPDFPQSDFDSLYR